MLEMKEDPLTLDSLTVRVDKSLLERMRRDAKQRGMSIQAWINAAIENELARRKWEDKKLEEIRKTNGGM
jgi:predicted transcriptional regulator